MILNGEIKKWQIVASSLPEDIVGLEGYKNWVTGARAAFPYYHITFDEIIVKGDNMVVRFTSTGTHTGPLSMLFDDLPPTGKKFRTTGLGIERVQNRKIIEILAVFNVLDMMQQLGMELRPKE